eukprot:CAMPEP_0204601330 /NCGR_PEP_ID=MMETSP0661-20131031/55961_1 /ASSEMBLY_ACC=CAM_ASM_000606 /TAXON_ID=109239 /ORGANISM="Alexandrium margalefi, Strain AMGDE01CS-322" /LENGTH=329 /DNA_ID=CAMNT_0051612181 /DNA_START=40 /DNA_END=1029 /DNA_ORIENTATION=+
MRALVPLCLLPAACCGLRHDRATSGAALRVKPTRRHIQYLEPHWGSGITDRAYVISWLADLAIYYNATLHMEFGPKGADRYLASKHSRKINSSWSHYFDVAAGCGVYPFNEVKYFEGCKVVKDVHTDFSTIFDDGSPCVNITQRKWSFKNPSVPLEAHRHCDIWGRGLSSEVYKASRQFLVDHKVPKRYGAYHIRRCDRMSTNGVCSEVEAVRSMIESITDVSTWLIFTYAEPGYIRRLKKALSPLREGPAFKRTFIFEDDVALSPLHDSDNYFAFLIANNMILEAPLRVETQYCRQSVGSIIEKPFAVWASGDRGRSDEAMFGVCGNR